MAYLQIFFTSLILTLFSTPLLIRYLNKQGIVDKPDGGRRIHTAVTPRMGGLIIFSVVLLVVFSFFEDLNYLRYFILGSIIIAICGILDDIIGLKWNVKFVLQFIVAIVTIISFWTKFEGIDILGFELPSWIGYTILFFFIVGTINSINLMDGLDGLVSGYAIIKSMVLLLLVVRVDDVFGIIFLTGFLGALLGFLKYNAFPARIFLGDTGSLVIGYFLVYLTLHVSIEYSSNHLELAFPIILLAAPIFDTLKVMFVRIREGNNPFHPDKNHLHHIIIGSNIRHKSAVFIVQIYSMLFSFLAVLYILYKTKYALLGFFALLLLLISTKKIFDFLATLRSTKFINEKFNSIPIYFVKFYKYLITPLSFIAIVMVLLYSFPNKVHIESKFILIFFVIGASLFTLSLFHNSKTKFLNHIYVFFNLIFFFMLFYREKIILGTGNLLRFNEVLFIGSLTVVLLFIVLFIVTRNKVINPEDHFLSGIDLTMILIFILLSVLNQIISNNLLEVISFTTLFSLISYFWYRVFISIYPRFSKTLFYFSYALPFISLFV